MPRCPICNGETTFRFSALDYARPNDQTERKLNWCAVECPPKARLLETWKSPKLRYSSPQLSTCRLLPASASHLLLPRTDQCNVRVRETFERCRIFDLESLSVGSLPCRRRFLRLRSPSTWQSGPVRSQRSDSQPPSITAIHRFVSCCRAMV